MKCKQTWISPSRIAVFLIASLGLAAAGVSAQVPGAGQPSSQTMQRQSATPLLSSSLSFVAVRAYDSGGLDPESVVIADVNLDGKLDVVAANYSATVGVLLGNGDGTFQPTVSYYSGAGFTAAVAIADVNLDGKPDLIVADAYENSYGVLLGNGDGTFQPVVTYTGFGGWAVAVADFNRDGKPDLAMPNSYPNTIGVLLGRGDGTFQDPVFYDPGGDYCNGLAAADLNHDGKADLVVTSAEAAGVLLGNGDGTFQPSVTYPTGGNFYPESDSPVIADVNRDGKPDLVVGNWASGTVGVLLGNGDGTFQPVSTYSAFGQLQTVAVPDVNGDGLLDVVVASDNKNQVGVLLGNGNGAFQTPLFYDTGYYAEVVAAADLNADGKMDLVVGPGSVGVLMNDTGAPPTTTTLLSGWNPAPDQQAIIYTATVTAAQVGGTTTGFVLFREDGKAVANIELGDNHAAITRWYEKGGRHSITASYSGDLKNAGSTSPTLVEYISSLWSTTVVTTSGTPSLVKQPVTFTAIVTTPFGKIPDGGLVTFYDGSTVLAAMPLAGQRAVFTTSSLSAKKHVIYVTYAGDTKFKPSHGAVVQIVNPYATTTTLRSSVNPSAPGQAVTFTAKVSSAGTMPTGKVVFKDGTLWTGSAILSGGIAKITKWNLASGTHPITAEYLGDAVSGKSTPPVLNQIVH